MNSKRTRRTPQGIAGVTFSQGLRLEKSEEKDYLNISQYLSKFKKNNFMNIRSYVDLSDFA